jgi:hypothetical protein
VPRCSARELLALLGVGDHLSELDRTGVDHRRALLEACLRGGDQQFVEMGDEVAALDLPALGQLADALRDSRADLGDLTQVALGLDRDAAVGDVGLDALGQVQQPQVLADPGVGDRQLLGDLLVGAQTELLGQRLQAAGGVDWVEVLAVVVLDQRRGERVARLTDVDRHLLDAGDLGRLQASVPGDDDEPAVAVGPDRQRLHHVRLAEAGGEPLEALGVHVGAGVEAVLDLDLCDLDQGSG